MDFVLLLIFALLPFSIEKKVHGVWVTSTDILILAAIVFWVYLAIRRRVSLKDLRFPLIVPIAMLMAIYTFSIFVAVDPILSLSKVIKLCLLFVFFYLVVNNISEKKYLLWLIYVITASVTLLSMYFLLDTFRMTSTVATDMLLRTRMWERHIFSAMHLNLLGMILVVTIPICLFCLFYLKSLSAKILIIFALLIQSIALALTYSRGNWIALAIILVILFTIKYKAAGTVVSVELISLPFLIMIIFFTKIDMSGRLFSMFDSQEGSYLSRWEHVKMGFSLFKMKPLTGVGIGNFQLAVKKYFGANVTEIVHNLFLQCAVDAGIFCALVMLFLLIKYFFDARSILQRIKDDNVLNETALFCILSFGGLIISAQFGDPFTRYIKEYFALLLALPYAIKRIYILESVKQKNIT